MKLAFDEVAWAQYVKWLDEDRKVIARINALIGECLRDPFHGTGKPEPLRQTLAGWWSRRISGEHRLVYRVRGSGEAEALDVLSCRYQYQSGARSTGQAPGPSLRRMTRLSLTLPDDLSAWAESRAADRHMAGAGDYLADLLRRDREEAERLARLQAAIDEGLASGVSEIDPFDYIESLRETLRASGGSADAA